jgi:hypothetical protein
VIGCGADERVWIGIAADNAIHHDDVCRRDGARFTHEVAKPSLDAVGHPVLAEQLRCDRLVSGRKLDVGDVCRPGLQQLELDLADTTADLEDVIARRHAAAYEADDALRIAGQAATRVVACLGASVFLVEDLVVVIRLAAGRHGMSLAHRHVAARSTTSHEHDADDDQNDRTRNEDLK